MKKSGRHLGIILGVAAGLSAAVATIAIAADKDLIVFDWAGYEEPSFHPGYVAKNGESPTFAFFGDEDEAFEKVRSGFKSDLGHPCSQSVKKWREAGLLQPLDTTKIAGWNDLAPNIMAMKDLATTADGKAWFMPWDWGNTSLTYNTDKVDAKDVQSLKAFADPKFKDRVSIGDNVDDAYALASLAIGLKDWTQMTDEQFKQASDFLREVHKNVRLYWTDTTEIVQAMGGGEVDLAWAWNDAATQLTLAGTPAARKPDTDEGNSTWVCGYVRFKDAPGSEAKAYDFLNAVNDPAIATYMVNDWGYGMANAKGMASVDPKLLADKGYGNNDKSAENTLFQSPLPNALKAKMIAEFEKIKAGY
ncbi:putative spermidine/putrescine transport system substrate-binding protein/spermidine/putrescine transport system substrate-binding protein [Phyllobacterium sp. 1468]|uniref:extracellular solute-binding protein n=1 Tax=Phyllobacterium sp. 1468 TaxID=2817759 RepID=UPI001AEAD095|nr:extracellular solute-binding protein [Phyllobacterium sp. 1468]MDR6634760.1 putative spermidine/putrescine transport system substrate-binding protein/spermidine/putrescine transport system substrate-binding protein [Phyllobacterium sp. 1468]